MIQPEGTAHIKIDGVVVFYNPETAIEDNIHSYLNEIDRLYIVDNSEIKNIVLIEKLKQYEKIQYIDNQGNQGIAHALNIGAQLAMQNKADWLLTMDQDSRASEHMIPKMLECIDPGNKKVPAIISPFHASKFHTDSKESGCVEKKMVMTSGNLLSLEAYENTGSFSEELFLDYVDNEYCFRLQKHGYRIIQASEAILYHNLGELSRHTLFGKNIYCYNYPPVRYYYRTRNVIAVNKKLGYFDYLYLKELFKDIIKISLYEKQKMKKFQYIYRGIVDAIRGRMGIYDR
jgi:rhamnosyltransferase